MAQCGWPPVPVLILEADHRVLVLTLVHVRVGELVAVAAEHHVQVEVLERHHAPVDAPLHVHELVHLDEDVDRLSSILLLLLLLLLKCKDRETMSTFDGRTSPFNRERQR